MEYFKKTKVAPDLEMAKNYQLEITAQDKRQDSIPSSAAINVKVCLCGLFAL